MTCSCDYITKRDTTIRFIKPNARIATKKVSDSLFEIENPVGMMSGQYRNKKLINYHCCRWTMS